jgi:hypothetical protein
MSTRRPIWGCTPGASSRWTGAAARSSGTAWRSTASRRPSGIRNRARPRRRRSPTAGGSLCPSGRSGRAPETFEKGFQGFASTGDWLSPVSKLSEQCDYYCRPLWPHGDGYGRNGGRAVRRHIDSADRVGRRELTDPAPHETLRLSDCPSNASRAALIVDQCVCNQVTSPRTGCMNCLPSSVSAYSTRGGTSA